MLVEYIRYRDWHLRTKLEDEISALVMEYTWQHVCTGETEHHLPENEYYYNSFRVCYGGAELKPWLKLLRKRDIIDDSQSIA